MSRTPPQPLPWIPKNGDIVPAMRRHLDEYAELVQQIISTVEPESATHENVMYPLVRFADKNSGASATIFNLKYFMPDAETQRLAEEAESLHRQDKTWLDPKLCDLLMSVRERAHPPNEEMQRLLDDWILNRESYGLGLPNLDADAIEARRARSLRIDKLCADILRNSRSYKGGEWFSDEELVGVPAKSRAESDRPDGKAFYSHTSKYLTIMQYADLPATRERMLQGFHHVAKANAEAFREIMLLRDQNAREIGATNHAETKLSERCADSVTSVQKVLDDVVVMQSPFGREAYERVKETKCEVLKKQSNSSAQDHSKQIEASIDLVASEYAFFERIATENDKVDHKLISQWFPLRHTFRAMLDLFADYLQLEFVEMKGQDIEEYIWHHDVQVFSAWDKRKEHDGAFIGNLFADVINRPNKHRNAQSVNLQPGYIREDGTQVYPANIIQANFSNFHEDMGYLLTHGNVMTLFHELGHSMHDLLSRTEHHMFHGYTGASELVEGIGQMLTEWCWIPSEITKLSLHYTRTDPKYAEKWLQTNPGQSLPPEAIPIDLLEPQIKRKNLLRTLSTLGLMVDALFDLKIYSPATHEELLEMDFEAIYGGIYKKLRYRDMPRPSYQYCRNTIITSVYDAGYYSYIFAEIFAADFFQTRFATDPCSRETWQKFREEVLEPGSSRKGVDLIRNFLGGRDADPKKLLVGVDQDYIRPSLRDTTTLRKQ